MSVLRPTGPNWLTLARMFATPLFLVLFTLSLSSARSDGDIDPSKASPSLLLSTLCLFLAIEASDILDGLIARRTGKVTEMGKVLDPLADTLNHVGAFLCLMWAGLAPLWLLLLLYYREAVVATLRVIAATKGLVVGARLSGKAKSVVLGGSAAFTIFFLLLAHYWPEVPVKNIATGLCALSGAVVAYSFGDYVVAIAKLLRQHDGR